MFLFQQIDSVRDFTPIAYAPLPEYVTENLNRRFELRPYQEEAFRHFITFYESDRRPNPTQVLFHMATGSGKTLIMAGLILYLYKQGYRNFLFFVNLDNIVQKTKDNFLSFKSQKYLFNDEIVIDGEGVHVNEVQNFQGANPDSINICFTTTQGLHYDMWSVKEGAPSFDDFAEQKTVLIADEAHHLNVDTRRGKKSDKNEEANQASWETTVSRIFSANRDNVLLEFTATCDLQNPFILSEYENKIIYDYPLRKFREERYSKQVKAIRADIGYEERTLQALMFSQYRLKVFQDKRLDIKPVVLFKSKTIAESKAFEQQFYEIISTLRGAALEKIVVNSPLVEVKRMADYYASKDIDFDELAQELREEFSHDHCLSVNDEKEATERQIILNSLENKDNPYRAIFEVKKLDEGWDVLNLFDIVRLYETRDAKNGKPGSTTIAEAQLIGRGARYCPFVIEEDDEKYKRKYDGDTENSLRVCEELYYHCQYDSRYIDELNKALIATGIMPDSQTEVRYELKEAFKKDDLFKTGIVFANKRVVKSRRDVVKLLPSVRDKEYTVTMNTGKTAMDTMMMDAHTNTTVKTFSYKTTIGKIAEYSYSIVHGAARRVEVLKFNVLRTYFPNLKSMREFITDPAYLGNIKIVIESREQTPSPKTLYAACLNVLTKIGIGISAIKETYEGTTDFTDKKFSDVFRSKTRFITDPHGEGEGISQNAAAIRPEWKLDLGDADWFVFNDNYGTTEEKSFVAYFASHVEALRKEYDAVYLVRNERQLALYSFDGGERFEPDYLIFLRKPNTAGFEQYQIFVEPKGSHLLAEDRWKEEFLLQIENRGIPKKTFADDNEYRVWGFSFYNQDNKMSEFSSALERLLP